MSLPSSDDAVAARTAEVNAARNRAASAWQAVADAATGLATTCADPATATTTINARTHLERHADKAHRASNDLDEAKRLLKAAITRRDTLADEARKGLAPLRTIRDAIDEALNGDAVPGLSTHFTVRSTGRNGKRNLTISWQGMPVESQVRVVINAHLAQMTDQGEEPRSQQVAIALSRQLLWSCGIVHDDTEDAFIDHEATDEGLLTWDERAGGYVLDDETRTELADEGRELVSRCTPGQYVQCPACWGIGTSEAYRKALTAWKKGSPPIWEACPVCDGRRVLDLDVEAQAAAYEVEMPNALAAARKYAAAQARRNTPGGPVNTPQATTAGEVLARLREHHDHPVTTLTAMAEPGMDARITALFVERLTTAEEPHGVYALIPFGSIRAACDALAAYSAGQPHAPGLLASALSTLLDGP